MRKHANGIGALVVGLSCVALAGLLACGQQRSFPGAAQEEFTKTYSCPKDRVVVTERPDLKSFDLEVGRRDTPPADVARDPGRLAEWNKRQQELEDGYKYDHVFFVRGCDHETYYRCMTAETTNQQQTIACVVPAHPPGSPAAAATPTPTVTAAPTVAADPPASAIEAPKKPKKP